MNNSINLLGHRDHQDIKPASERLKLLRAIAVFLLFGVSAAAIILYILISFSALPQVQQREQQALQTIAGLHADMTKIAFIEDRLTGIKTVLANRTKYDIFLDEFVAKMSPDITIQQVSMKEKSASVTVRSESLDSINLLIEKLIVAGNNKEYKQVVLNNITSSDANNVFTATVSVELP